MNQSFYERPIINSPYEEPKLHWKLDRLGKVLKTLTIHIGYIRFCLGV